MKLLGTDQSARDIYLNQNRTKSATEPQMTQHRNTERFFYPVSIRKYRKWRKWRKVGGSWEAGGDPWETWEGRKARPHSTHSVRREAGEVGKDRRIVPETLVCSGPEASGGFRGPQRRSGATYIQSGAWPSNSPWLCSDCETL